VCSSSVFFYFYSVLFYFIFYFYFFFLLLTVYNCVDEVQSEQATVVKLFLRLLYQMLFASLRFVVVLLLFLCCFVRLLAVHISSFNFYFYLLHLVVHSILLPFSLRQLA
jgi:hypothetical protein